jgi:hypothetical protein
MVQAWEVNKVLIEGASLSPRDLVGNVGKSRTQVQAEQAETVPQHRLGRSLAATLKGVASRR